MDTKKADFPPNIAERNVGEVSAFLQNILESSTEYFIIVKDLNQRIISWNEWERRNYGYAAEEILGKNSKILHMPEDITERKRAEEDRYNRRTLWIIKKAN